MRVVKLHFDETALPAIKELGRFWIQLKVINEGKGCVSVEGDGTIIDLMLHVVQRLARNHNCTILVEEMYRLV